MVASQLIVRRTFLEVQGCGLKDASARVRSCSDFDVAYSYSCVSCGLTRKDNCSDSEAETVSAKFCWSEAEDDWSSDDDATSLCKAVAPLPAVPPGSWQCSPVQQNTVQQTGVNKRGLWNAPVEQETRTTVLFRNVLATSKRSDLCMVLNNEGFRGQYDFLYVPANFKTMLSFGYAFVNFVSGQVAEAARQHFDGFQWSVQSESSVLETSWSNPHQGYEIHVERYRDCPVMHSSVSDEYKPIVLRGGVRVPFPAPTKLLIAPRDVRRRHGA
jgi:hypothetical protein